MTYIGDRDYFLEVYKGNIVGSKIVNKFGRNGAVGTALSFISISGNYQTPLTVILKAPLQVIPQKTDVGFFAKVGTGTASVSTEFQLMLVQN